MTVSQQTVNRSALDTVPRAGLWASILFIGLLALSACAQPEPASPSTSTAAPPPSDIATASPVPATSTPLGSLAPTEKPATPAEPQCLTPPPLERSASDAVRIDGEVGVPVTLDGRSLFDVPEDVSTFTWQQVFGTPGGVEYVTNHVAELSGDHGPVLTFTPQVPGNYRIRLTAAGMGGAPASHDVDVWVTKKTAATWDAKGAIFADLWGQLGGPEFDVAPEDPECLERALDHAFAGPLRVGAGWVGFVPANFIVQVLPTPVLRPEGNYHSLTDDDYYATLVAAAHERGLKVVHFEQDAPHFQLSPEEMAALETARSSDPAWWDAWFTQWKVYVVARAARAEANGVEMFVPYLMADGTFRPDVYPQYAERWRDILAAIREVYSGTLAMSFVNADERVTFIDAFDAAFITVFPALYTTSGRIADLKDPTMKELTSITEGLFTQVPTLIEAGMPVYYILVVNSSDGQTGSEDIGAKKGFGVDFQEQALYYEAFFKAASEKPWIRGVFTERWDWFDQYRRSAGTREAIYFDQTIESSPRSKPAEDVVRLWFSVH